MTESERFTGFSPQAVGFYQELELNNSKQWWARHVDTYTHTVREPMVALLAELEPDFGAAKMFRPHRDVRFTVDKSPYKTHQGAYCATDSAAGYYVQIGPNGLFVGGGNYQMAADQLARYREAVADEPAGEALGGILEVLRHNGFEVGGDRLVSRPRGVAPDHPRLDLLRHKTLTASRSYGEPPWLNTPEAAARVRTDWQALRPLLQWLSAHVGSTRNPRR